jgi:type I restriction enzyme M protein
MFVQSERFVEAHGGRIGAISVYGQESNPTTWKLYKMNMAIRGIDGNIGPYAADTFHHDLHPDLQADYILANPPFNVSDWGGDLLAGDKRWVYGLPPSGNANFAWVQHMIHHLAAGGRAGFVLANGSMSSNSGGEGDIRRAIVEADLVDCMVALPPQLFYNTQIPACLWFLDRAKPAHRAGQTLFIDARGLGTMIDRTRRELTEEDIGRIAAAYHAWLDPQRAQKSGFSEAASAGDVEGQKPDFVESRAQESQKSGFLEPASAGDAQAKKPDFLYADVPGFCKSAAVDEIAGHDYVLTPGRYVGAADVEDDGEPFEEKMERLTAQLAEQFELASSLQSEILDQLAVVGYGHG